VEAIVKLQIESKKDQAQKRILYLLDGELDVQQAKELRSKVSDELLEEPNWTYTLDLTRVSYLDSSGLGMLVYLKKEISRRNGKLSLTGLQESVANVFRLTRLDDFFELPPKAGA